MEQGDLVRVARASVFLPSRTELQEFAPGDEELEGTIIGFSDSGSRPKAYAVVEVVRRLSLVVPVEQLRVTSSPSAQPMKR